MNSSDCRASKIITNDTEAEAISWVPNTENSLFNFCVGVWVGGPPRQNILCLYWATNHPNIEELSDGLIGTQLRRSFRMIYLGHLVKIKINKINGTRDVFQF